MVLDGPDGPPTTGPLVAIEIGDGAEVIEGEVVGIDVGTVSAEAGPGATTVWPAPPEPRVEGFDKAAEGAAAPASAVVGDSEPAEDGLCAEAMP